MEMSEATRAAVERMKIAAEKAMTTLNDAETEVHGEPCFCELFSDLYKDIHGIRPRGDWPCERVRE